MKHPVDVHVGHKIRHRRWLAGITQKQLADACGIKFQQIQKYENGSNRCSASRLWDIACALDVPVSHFFEGFEGDLPDKAPEPYQKDDLKLAVAINRMALWYPESHAAITALVHSMGREELAGAA